TGWISLLLPVILISACRTLKIEMVGTDQTQDSTQALFQTSRADEASDTASPSDIPTAMNTPPSFHTHTPTLESEPTSSPAPIPHFLPGEPITISYIDMFDATTGWAVGRDEETSTDHILTTLDGGYTWRDVTPAEPLSQEMNEYTYRRASVFFLDGQRASVIYDPEKYGDPARTWSTSSAGYQWEISTIDTNFQVVEDLTFTDGSHGWLMLGVDAGMGHAWIGLYRMSVDGQQWDLLIDPYSENSADLHYCCKTGMVFHGSDTGLVTFGRGLMGGAFINWTEDGGSTWEAHPLPRPDGAFEELGEADYGILCGSHSPTLFSPQFNKVALECWSDFENTDLASFIFTTQDGGTSWQSEIYPGGQLLFLNPRVGWALGKEIYQTLDVGQTWTKMSTVDWEGQFSFVSERLGWAVARNAEEYALVQTSDGGKIWDIIEPVVVE
ncbi:MAG: hypothetical protein A2Z14_00005, partial [Chloroflexi bacterium RBG_16_48_8]